MTNTTAEGPGVLFMIDPAWATSSEAPEPPSTAIAGRWVVADDGSTGRFEPNPDYVPSGPESPTDPADAALMLLARGEADGDELLAALEEVPLAVAVEDAGGDAGTLVVRPAPDGVPALLVATSPWRRSQIDAPSWGAVTPAELAAILPAEGVDILLNPGAPTWMRLPAAALRRGPPAEPTPSP